MGSLLVPALSPWWILAALGLLFWLTPSREGSIGRRTLVASGLFLLSFVLLTAWRSRALHPSTSLEVLVDGEVGRRAVSLQIDRRNELRRLTGKRRNVSIEAKGVLEVQDAGTHVLELSCDDACEIAVGGDVVRAEGLAPELALPRGEIPLEIRYRQDSGPARLRSRGTVPASSSLSPSTTSCAPPRQADAAASPRTSRSRASPSGGDSFRSIG
jgi:hypothetical protein